MQAFRALRVLSEQRYLERCSSDTTTHGVQVEVTSQFVKVRKLRPYNDKVITYY